MSKIIIYDAYGTLFDVTSVDKAIAEYYPEQAKSIGALWRKKQIEYAFIKQMTGNYEPFSEVTRQALRYALSIETGAEVKDVVDRCMQAYEKLDLFPESLEVLKQQQGVTNVILSNGSRDMLEPLIENSSISGYIDKVISIDDIKQYKPSQAAYQYGLRQFDTSRDKILFISSNTWDIVGAKTFGYKTFWINRGDTDFEKGRIQPDEEAADLKGILNN
ncbi:haloacid dehalogenase type II [Alkalicoccus daliensis]|uniref:2-haloacid dehalogenase n=1 Tax=Alkalicoccus daliensis TaxID=745820 RepID=A0A1H0HX16_9BACI|nr:haloacid dehalogenase type II [Alkalicoccus daliensis]SDO23341.1 2-haloacid dehalogenase [Alkalicoccus daliensis]